MTSLDVTGCPVIPAQAALHFYRDYLLQFGTGFQQAFAGFAV